MVEKFHEFLDSHKVLNLGYTFRGFPHSCALWYAHDENFNFYYLSSENTNHGSIHRGSPISFTINRDDQEWDKIRGVQGRGLVFPSDSEKGWELYMKKFPFVTNENLSSALKESKLWMIKPNWLRLIDNTIEFGYKEEMKL